MDIDGRTSLYIPRSATLHSRLSVTNILFEWISRCNTTGFRECNQAIPLAVVIANFNSWLHTKGFWSKYSRRDPRGRYSIVVLDIIIIREK